MKKVLIIATSLVMAMIAGCHPALAQNLPLDWKKDAASLPMAGGDLVRVQQGGKDKYVTNANYAQSNGKHFSLVVTGVNMKTAAATTLLTVPTGMTFIMTGLKVETTAANTLTGGAAWTAGSTGTAANSLVASTTGSASATAGTFESYVPKANATVIAAADVVQFTLVTPATATSQTASIHLSGYFR